MYPALSLYYERALQIYTYEKADGYGKACDLVLQGFMRHMCLAIVPVVLSTMLLYFLVRSLLTVSCGECGALEELPGNLRILAAGGCCCIMFHALTCTLGII